MKKKLFILAIAILLIIPYNALAATGSYSITSSSSVEVGNTISVTFKISAPKLFYWQAYITYDTSKLELKSGSTAFQGEADSLSGQSSTSKTLKFKAKKQGNAWVAISMGDRGNNINANTEEISFSKKTKNITIKEKVVKTYSSNNNLKSLSIDGYNLSPAFNKNTLEYNVELPAQTEQIKINATKEDQYAQITGIGNQKVSEGNNKLVVKVTAENGNTKEYIINAKVKELSPIEVMIGNEKYTVIRKREQLPKANETFIVTTTKIENEEVPALTSEITKYTLIGLKDTEGTIKLYKVEDEKYEEYKEITFNKIVISPINDTSISIPKGYKETEIIINEEKVKAYVKDSYPIFVGMNIETGEKALYSYDKDENTVQRFKTKEKTTNIIANNDMYTYIITILGGTLIITYLGILISLLKKKKKHKTITLNNNKNEKDE